ncbi:2-acylglycerol O-acyltransferase 2-A-like [Antedon mediterranea]|uniref:2-acylglycerol O-acyltransferase 2-A-like n=1 Tax=Antedon mediterranea TaxID=105859 RepID=UPI003AF46875
MKFLGISFAPLVVPLHRRLETFAVAQWCILFLVGGLFCFLFLLYLLTTSFYWVTILAYIWFYIDWHTSHRGGRRSQWMVTSRFWRHMANYFPARLHKTADLDLKHNYMFGFHPHGVMGIGAFISFGTDATDFSKKFPGLKPTLLILSQQFYFPLWRDYLMSVAICDVNRESVDYSLGKCGESGNAVIIVVGGAIESLEAHPNSHTLYLKGRKGFVKRAIIHGAHLVPVYSFGETDIYEQIPNPPGSRLKWFQTKMTKILGFAPPIFHGRGIFNYTMGIIPYRKPINTVVGKPIAISKDTSPSQEKVDRIHQEYVESLETLFEENKTKYGVDPDKHLTLT